MAVDRVRQALRAHGIEAEVLEFSAGTRTAEEAARAVGTTPAQIVKSLVFLADGRPVLALVSGANRVDLRKLARAVGAGAVTKADAETVREVTGFAIGGVPPVGHRQPLPVVMDQDLLPHPVVYAAAGTPRAVFPIAPARLRDLTGATVVDLRDDHDGPRREDRGGGQTVLEFETLRRLLREVQTIAVVGLSADEEAESYGVAAYLQQAGYRIIPVNPRYAGQTILGERVYASLREVPVPVDIVDVFRRPDGVPPIAEDALALSPRPKLFWMQVGIEHPEAARRLEAAGVPVVQNVCLRATHRLLALG